MKPPELPVGLYWPPYKNKKTGEQRWSTKAIWC